ncbi:hypothetical protein FE257_004914 [Aspergillus nanangensis]|uniref:FAD-binding PCMH-type domain-containing protein n=1 Tax=Aspergillus nanangensis TaxID=2582783 RepID=A0AAD4CAK0_ASPNN|nr:hypothetical protein FE257_004914 [Aspergillus nanangensis]
MRIILLIAGILLSVRAQPWIEPPDADYNVTVGRSRCRCQPHQPCWPKKAEWAALNRSIAGSLVAVRPLGHPCHIPSYNETQCAIVQANTQRSSYRAAQPGAMQWQNWESWPQKNQKCYVGTPQSERCAQGRISIFSAEVDSAQDIQAVVRFAGQHNIKLALKNTGHDFLGRSTAPGSLEIFTRRLKNITIVDRFVPVVPRNVRPPAPVRVVTLGAGVQLHEMNTYLGCRGTVVVGGSSSTVGVAGGYIQGGGHSLLGWLHGMASDNAVEFEVVLASGRLVIANAYQNPDLFFALRGGGGGTFGVVTSVTVRAHSDDPVVSTQTTYTLPTPNETFWAGVEAINRHIIRLNDQGGTGSYNIMPQTSRSGMANATASTVQLSLYFVNQTDVVSIDRLLQPLLKDLHAAGLVPSLEVQAYASASSMYAATYTGEDPAGSLLRVGSRLVSRAFMQQRDSARKIADTLSNLAIRPNDYIGTYIVGGGQVAQNKGIVTSGLNPAWREAIMQVGVLRFADLTSTLAEQAEVARIITDQDVAALRSLEPGKMGAYASEADADEADFQRSFWGGNYPRLYDTKKRMDPGGMFIVRKGVGSEDWDEEGLCRIS